jgi:hypothetical protein
MNLLIAILLAYGLTNIVVQGTIFYPFKEWLSKKIANGKWYSKSCGWFLKLINCPMCFGFWAGALAGFFCGPFPFWNILFNGCIYSGTTWLIYCLSQFLGQGYDPSRTFNVMFQNKLEMTQTKTPYKDINSKDK